MAKRKQKGREEKEPPFYMQVFDGGRKYETHSSVKMNKRKPWQKPNPQEIRSMISCTVLSMSVQEGETVEKNQQIMEFEAMKMHNVIYAPFAGVVEQVLVTVGDKMPKGALMMVISPNESVETTDDVGTLRATSLQYDDFDDV